MNLEGAVEQLIQAARNQGLNIDCLGVSKASTAIAFQDRKLEQFATSETCQLGVRVVDGHKEGLAYTEDLSPESLIETLNEARNNARAINKDWIADLAPANPSTQSVYRSPELYDPNSERISTDEKLAAARNLEGAALDADSRIKSVPYSRYFDNFTEVWVANTNGLMKSYKTGSIGGYAYCLAQDGDSSVSDGDQAVVRNFAQFDPVKVAQEAAERTLLRLNAIRPKTGLYTVVLLNRVAEEMIGLISGYFSAKAVDEKTSPLAGKLDSVAFSQHLTLIDDPLRSDASGARPFDAEGFSTGPTKLIDKGRLTAFLTNSLLAKKLGLPHTASAARQPSTELDITTSNLTVTPGGASFSELTAADGQVIVITQINGHSGFRATSGDFSLPVEGQLYRDGIRQCALKDFLISGNILELLGQIERVGSDVLPPTSDVISPSLLVRNVNVSGEA